MKIRIDHEGFLHIERAGAMKVQRCPHWQRPCGDHCPLFGEPNRNVFMLSSVDDGISELNICDTYLVGEIQDDRGK